LSGNVEYFPWLLGLECDLLVVKFHVN
jgi:hypothetical protein